MNGANLQRMFDCWEDFKNNNSDNECKKFIDLFYPELWKSKNTNNKLEISVGKRKANGFQSYLNSVHNNFDVLITSYKNEPQLIFKNKYNTITIINLKAMDNLSVNVVDRDDISFYQYTIYFRYMNKIDYHIDMTIWKEDN